MAEWMGLLLFFMIVGAVVAVETSSLLASVISVGAVGFGVSIAFLFLGAPDIAITQIVVEVLALIILIRATISRDITAVAGGREFFGRVVTLGLILIIFLFSLQAFEGLPEFGTPEIGEAADRYLRKGMEDTGAANAVTSVILDYRAYDTLGEATVLFTAIFGALALLRPRARTRVGENERE